MKEAISFVVGLILGWISEKFLGWLWESIKKYCGKKKIEKANSNYIRNDENIHPLSHGTPFFEKNTLILSAPTQEFHMAMPKDIHDEVIEKNPDFEHTLWHENEEYFGKGKDETQFIEDVSKIVNDTITKDEIHQSIERQKREIGEMLLKRFSEPFFNGEMYGIKQINDERVGNEEKEKVTITSVKTDYYTHRVMAAVYQEMLQKNQIQSPEGMRNVNAFYPFLTSMGMNVLLVIEKQDKIVLAKRSKQLINMKEDQWHLSVNEAISITDLSCGRIDLEGCVRRGFMEELGLDCNKFNQVNSYFSDIFMLKNPLEIGILGFVIMDEVTERDVRNGYNIAQDAIFESTGTDETGLMFLKFKERAIEEFCKKENVTAALKYALKMLCIRRNQL